MAMARTAQRQKAGPRRTAGHPRPRQNSLIWLQGLLCGAMVTLAAPTALLLGVLLAPGLLALMLDRDQGRPRARCIILCAMAASIEPLRILWTMGHSMATATSLLGNLGFVGTAWSAAAGGWLLAEATPVVTRALLEAISIARGARLRTERARLVQAWGLEPAPDDQ
jgi:hypothetical protein